MKTIIVLLAVVLIFIGLSQSVSGANKDVYEILNEYGFPSGVLPNNVKTYSLTEDGDFSVELKSECIVQFTDELVHYDKHITGKLRGDSFSVISGIQEKKLFVLLPITNILMVTDRTGQRYVQFNIGALAETMPVYMFQNIPSCRTGLASL